MTRAVAVLISGNGSNLQAILDATQEGGQLHGVCEVHLVVSNRKAAFGLERAQKHNVPTMYFPLKPFKDQGKSREEYDAALAAEIKQKGAYDLVVLAGWMHVLSSAFLDQFPRQVINLHPALPGQFAGTEAIKRAYEAYQKQEIDHTGVMVHYVIPEVDAGATIDTAEVPINKEDSLEDLETRMHHCEHGLLVSSIRKLLL